MTRSLWHIYSGVFTLTVAVTDVTAGLDAILFPSTVSVGGTYTQGGAISATVPHTYTFDAATNVNGSYAITITDRAGNETIVPFSVHANHISPTVTLLFFDRHYRARTTNHDRHPGAVVGGGDRFGCSSL